MIVHRPDQRWYGAHGTRAWRSVTPFSGMSIVVTRFFRARYRTFAVSYTRLLCSPGAAATKRLSLKRVYVPTRLGPLAAVPYEYRYRYR